MIESNVRKLKREFIPYYSATGHHSRLRFFGLSQLTYIWLQRSADSGSPIESRPVCLWGTYTTYPSTFQNRSLYTILLRIYRSTTNRLLDFFFLHQAGVTCVGHPQSHQIKQLNETTRPTWMDGWTCSTATVAMAVLTFLERHLSCGDSYFAARIRRIKG